MSDDLCAKAEELTRAYALTFGSPSGQIVLADLELYCNALEGLAKPGQQDRTWMNLGRHEVFQRIQKFANVSIKDLYQLHLGRPSLRDEQGDKIDG